MSRNGRIATRMTLRILLWWKVGLVEVAPPSSNCMRRLNLLSKAATDRDKQPSWSQYPTQKDLDEERQRLKVNETRKSRGLDALLIRCC